MPRRRRGRLPRVAVPRATENALFRAYAQLLDRLEDQTLERVLARIESLYSAAGAVRMDGWVDELADLMESITGIDIAAITGIASTAGRQTAIVTGTQTRAQMNALFGIDIFREPAASLDMVDAFTRQNVNLIKSVEATVLKDVERLVSDALRQGVRNADLAKELRERFDVSRSRAKLIAVDQLGKLNSQLTRVRHQSLGITQYVWRTVGDERVRSEHRARSGKRYSYDNPPSGGHPGEPIRCRCYEEPVLPPEFDEE